MSAGGLRVWLVAFSTMWVTTVTREGVLLPLSRILGMQAGMPALDRGLDLRYTIVAKSTGLANPRGRQAE